MNKCCHNCAHWDKEHMYFNAIEGEWTAPCECPDKPPSTGFTYVDDTCREHEEVETIG